MDGGYSGCVGGFYGHQSITRANHSGRISVGIKQILNYSEKISMQNSINFSNSLLICTEDKGKNTDELGVYSYYNVQALRKIDASLNLQTGLFYKLSEKTSIGITAEYFFRSKTLIPSKHNEYTSDFGWGINTKSTLLTAGIRLQHSF